MFSDIANVPHWYILTYIGSHRDAEKRLAMVDMPSYVPQFFTKDSKPNGVKDFRHFVNYAFVLGTQNQIYEQKRKELRSFNFLPQHNGDEHNHPFVEDYVVDQLRKIETIYGGKIPFMPYPTDVIAGDTVRILTGEFKDLQATAITKNGSKYRQILLEISDTFVIPLCKLKIGDYEIVKYSDKNAQSASKVRKEDITFLHNALERFYRLTKADDTQLAQDKTKIHTLINLYKNSAPSSPVQRVKTSLLLVMAYTTLDNEEKQVHYIKHSLNLMQDNKSLSLKANTYCILYGCTFNGEYYNQYVALRKDAFGTKDEKAFTKLNEQMETYRKWNVILHPHRFRHALQCSNDNTMWFALELSSPLKEVVKHLENNNIPTYNPEVTSSKGKTVLLAFSTFIELQKIQTVPPFFSFIREERDDHDEPLYVSNTEVDDYRYLLSSTSEGLEHIELTPEYHDIFTKSKTETININGRELHGIINTTSNHNSTQQRFIIYLRHLTAIAIEITK